MPPAGEPDANDLVILVPMLGRPHTVAPLRTSITEATPEARVVWLLTPGDDEVQAALCDGVLGVGDLVLFVERQLVGDYARKIHAGIAATTEPLIFTGACDLRFHKGWYERAIARLRPGIGVVGTNDRCNKRTYLADHATHFLVTRSYVEQHGTADERGKFFHEGYPHEYVDDEAVGTAKRRRAYAHAKDAIVEHLHPMNGKAPMDATYSQQAARIAAGRPLFMQRRKLWT